MYLAWNRSRCSKNHQVPQRRAAFFSFGDSSASIFHTEGLPGLDRKPQKGDSKVSTWCSFHVPTVDRRNPAPPGMYETFSKNGIKIIIILNHHPWWCGISAINSIIKTFNTNALIFLDFCFGRIWQFLKKQWGQFGSRKDERSWKLMYRVHSILLMSCDQPEGGISSLPMYVANGCSNYPYIHTVFYLDPKIHSCWQHATAFDDCFRFQIGYEETRPGCHFFKTFTLGEG